MKYLLDLTMCYLQWKKTLSYLEDHINSLLTGAHTTNLIILEFLIEFN